MTIRVGRWDCKTCGNIGNLGSTRECEKCGSLRPDDVKFYLPSDAEIVTDEEEIKIAKAGVDWICAFCDSSNSGLNVKCENCGASKVDSEKKMQEKEYSLDKVPQNSNDFDEKKQLTDIPKKQKKDVKIPKAVKYGFWFIVAFFLASIIFTKEIDVKVDGKSWERTIKIEKREKVEESGWSLPTDATLISKEEAIHHYNKIQTGTVTKTRNVQVKVGEEKYVSGQKDLGNGYFEDVYSTRNIYETRTEDYEEPVYRKEPVYKTKYYYSVWKWKKDDKLVKSGDNGNAVWPNVDAKNIRSLDSVGEYKIIILDHKNNKHDKEFQYSKWNAIKKGDILKAKKSTLLGAYLGLK
ncbi:MAG: Ran-binding zinc finger domain-containing protein [Bacteroidota bacterium]|nr:Ran-binding zinc finger domain-containing protein [Bacteroidota bacterium]